LETAVFLSFGKVGGARSCFLSFGKVEGAWVASIKLVALGFNERSSGIRVEGHSNEAKDIELKLINDEPCTD
jgi:hypothetical protein